MKQYLIVTLFALSLCTNTFAAKYPKNLEGKYECQGTEADNANDHFKGMVLIKKTGATYSITSSFDDGSSYIGTGIYDQTKHVLSQVGINPKKSEEIGVSMADVHPDYSLSSQWTFLHKTTIGHANCIKLS